MVIVDTNIIIDNLRKEGKTSIFKDLAKNHDICISVVTIQELYAGKSTRDIGNELILLKLLNALVVIPYNFEVSSLAGKLVRDSTKPLSFADAAIAATALHYKCDLATLNKKDFMGIPNLNIMNI